MPEAFPSQPFLDDDDFCEDERLNDFAGSEFLWLLRTSHSRNRAGKSYRPDPSGLRTAIKASDYKLGELFLANFFAVDNLEDFYSLLEEWSTDQSVFLIRGHFRDCWGAPRRRHRITGHSGFLVYRRSIERRGADGYFEEYPRKLQMLDLDGMPLPAELSVTENPEECVKWAVDHLLPPEFGQASFIYQLSSSAALTKLDNELNAHLWFITDESYDNKQLRAWALWWNAKRQLKILDPALFTAVQPHYVNEPELLDGLMDPLAGRRLGLVYRAERTVHLHMPSEAEIAAELCSRQKRAVVQFERVAKLSGKKSQLDIEAVAEDAAAVELDLPIEDEIPRSDVFFDAVRIGPGWQGYLNAIGFEGHIRAQILAAVGSYFWELGSRADRDALRAAIEQAIEESPFLDCVEPLSRSRADARAYLAAPPGGKSNVDELIADIGMRQLEKERLANDPWEAEWTLPTLTLEESSDQVTEVVRLVVVDALLRRQRLTYDDDIYFALQDPPRAAVNCSPGTGKTEAMVQAVAILVCLDDTNRVVIAVPTHKLGEGLAGRINTMVGKEVAREWYGIEQPDPQAPGTTMCRLAEAAKEVSAAGGKLQLLCSRRSGGQTEYCPYHPKIAGAGSCGYLRQQAAEVAGNTRVWIIPATMLAQAPPPALRRTGGLAGDFDLLVIDEAPWFALLKDSPKLSIEMFSPRWWETAPSRIGDSQKQVMLGVLTKIRDVLRRQTVGEVPVGEFAAAGIRQYDLAEARRYVWRYKIDMRNLVHAGMNQARVKKALAAVVAQNKRVMEVAEALYCMSLYLADRLAPSGMTLRDAEDGRHLHVRRRKEIDPTWLRAPTLYLDAAELSSFQIAKAWLPDLDLKVDAKAKAPHMTVTQLVDSEMSYSKLVSDGGDNATRRNNQEKVAKVIRNLGPDGLVVGPKRLCLAWEQAKALPAGWLVWNFGAVRGRDEAKAVSRLVVVSRPMPSVTEVEAIAETIFGKRLERLPPGSSYPKEPVGRLIADGKGKRALASRHPDPLVEAVRFAICEGELVQAVGRGRGVRRTADAPLEVLLLTNVPIPIPIDRLVTWKELVDRTGPLDRLFATGIVPLDYAGMAIALGGSFDDAAKVKDWFHYRAEAVEVLKALREWARDPEQSRRCEFSGNSHKESLIGFSAKLAFYRYRRVGGGRQSNVVIVNAAMHPDARAAVEGMLGPLEDLRPVDKRRQRRSRRGLDRVMGPEQLLAALARP